MSEKTDQILEELKTLTLMQASELITKVENTFGVDASAATSGSTMMMPPSNKIEDIEEKTEFNVILEKVPTDKKISILKVVRSLTGLGLKEAKEIVESAPKQIQEALTKDNANDVKKQLEEAGAEVSLT
jgi:large subunit ribosomal protein L7/L12